MTMTSLDHAMAQAHICDLLRTARRERLAASATAAAPSRRATRVLSWWRRGQQQPRFRLEQV